MSRMTVVLAVLLGTAACAESGTTGPAPTEEIARAGAPGRQSLTLLTQNLYPGANLDLVIGALASPDPADDLPALQLAIGTLRATDYPARARRLAEAIDRERPHVIGLQEVATIDLSLDLGEPIGISLDFLAILQAALQSRGLHYAVAAVQSNFVAAPLPGISFADADVMLVDADRVVVVEAGGHSFAANLGPVAPGVDLRRGWVGATLEIGGRRVAVATAHLESGSDPGLDGLRAIQATELAGSLPSGLPAFVIGDLNDVPGSAMHAALAGAGLADLWPALRPGVPGETCCHADALGDRVAAFDKRIDYVLHRPVGAALRGGRITLLGDQPAERTSGGVWISDHAGIVATIADR